MDFICNDRDSKWYFIDGIYTRIYHDGSRKRIRPSNLPNPHALLEGRIHNALRQGNTPDIELMKPTPAVYALWEHRLANNL